VVVLSPPPNTAGTNATVRRNRQTMEKIWGDRSLVHELRVAGSVLAETRDALVFGNPRQLIANGEAFSWAPWSVIGVDGRFPADKLPPSIDANTHSSGVGRPALSAVVGNVGPPSLGSLLLEPRWPLLRPEVDARGGFATSFAAR